MEIGNSQTQTQTQTQTCTPGSRAGGIGGGLFFGISGLIGSAISSVWDDPDINQAVDRMYKHSGDLFNQAWTGCKALDR